MIWKLALSCLGSYWREVAIVGLVLGLLAACHARDNAIRADQHSKDEAATTNVKLKSADSVNGILRDSLANVSAKTVTDSIRVVRWLTRTDSFPIWKHDTITVNGVPSFPVPVATVREDSAGKAACKDLMMDCAAFRKFAVQKFANDSGTIKTLKDHPIRVETSCKGSDALSFLIGAGIGGVTGALIHR